ncbi:MAG TPA: hypothetical protein PKC39_14460 [Ferruginibacter sp.]|nr:hypothetical protein [Ferruginibacter sp.]HMP22158.1 hypothetical protein [Ferruginibacter sp.]
MRKLLTILIMATAMSASAQSSNVDSAIRAVVRQELARVAITKAISPLVIDSANKTIMVYRATAKNDGMISKADFVNLQRIDSIVTALDALNRRIAALRAVSTTTTTIVQ